MFKLLKTSLVFCKSRSIHIKTPNDIKKTIYDDTIFQSIKNLDAHKKYISVELNDVTNSHNFLKRSNICDTYINSNNEIIKNITLRGYKYVDLGCMARYSSHTKSIIRYASNVRIYDNENNCMFGITLLNNDDAKKIIEEHDYNYISKDIIIPTFINRSQKFKPFIAENIKIFKNKMFKTRIYLTQILKNDHGEKIINDAFIIGADDISVIIPCDVSEKDYGRFLDKVEALTNINKQKISFRFTYQNWQIDGVNDNGAIFRLGNSCKLFDDAIKCGVTNFDTTRSYNLSFPYFDIMLNRMQDWCDSNSITYKVKKT